MNEETKMEGGFVDRKPLLEEGCSYGGAGGESTAATTPAVIFSTVVAVCSSFGYGCALSYSSPAQAGIMEDLGLSVADTMWLSQVFCTIGWLAIAFATSGWWLDIGRLSIGFGVGFVSYVIPVYVAEITPKESRGAFSYANQLLCSGGVAFFYFVGNVVSWRTLAVMGLVPGILQFVGLFFVPESPRWLAKVGREKELEATLQLLRGKNADISEEKTQIESTLNTLQENSEAKMADLFQKKYAYSLIVGFGLMILQQLGGITGVAYYAGAVVEKAGFPTSTGTIIFSLIQVPAAAGGLFLMDIVGRRPLLMVSGGGMCLCCFLVGLSFVLQGFNLLGNLTPIITVLGLTAYIATSSIGWAGIPWTMMSEIFPMNVKALAGSLVTLIHWSVSWLVTYTFNFMLQWNPAGTFFIFAGVCGASVVFTWKLVPETKGRTLEEIHASITSVQ